MTLHLFYKEWLKTKWFVLASLVLGIGTILYAFIGLNSNIINAEGGRRFAIRVRVVYPRGQTTLRYISEYTVYHCFVGRGFPVFAGSVAKTDQIDFALAAERDRDALHDGFIRFSRDSRVNGDLYGCIFPD